MVRSLYRFEIMAFTIIIIMVFIAASVNAGFVWQNDDNDFGNHHYKYHNNFPSFSSFPTFPSFPQISFPTMPPMTMMSPEDIAKKKGPNYNGIAVSSSSSSTVDKDGKVVKNGVITFISNENGIVKKYTFGDDPTKISVVTPAPILVPQPAPIIIPQIPIWRPIIPIMPLSPQALRTYKPGKNEHFVGTSSVKYTQASNVNGVKTSAGGSNVLSNVNGNIAEKTALFGENNS